MRLSWDDYFMQMALLVAGRSTCSSRKVGAVLVRDKHIISTGYNGSPPGMPHCDDPDTGCLIQDGRCVRTIHAEQNALLQAAVHGISTKNSTIYTTHRPCDTCSKLLVAAGVTKVVFLNGEPDGWGYEVLKSSNVQIQKIKN